MTKRSRSNKRKVEAARPSLLSTSNLLLLVVTHAACFLSGTIVASNRAFKDSLLQACPDTFQLPRALKSGLNASTTPCRPCPIPECPKLALEQKNDHCPACPACPKCPEAPNQRPERRKKGEEDKLFPPFVRKIAVGMAHTTRTEFAEKFNLGVPLDKTDGRTDRDVLFMYSKQSAMPTKMQESGSQTIDYATVDEATENCDYMHVLYHHRSGSRNLCLAIMPQYESFHIQKWMRVPERGEGDRKHPLRLVGRGMKWDGVDEFEVPKFERQTKHTWSRLKDYLETLQDVLKELKQIVKKIKIDNTVVVMVCNHGQSELLLNFVCSAKSRGLDTSNVLVFATDEATKEIAESVGLMAYYDEKNFGRMPETAAGEYGDQKFVEMMFAKVMCVHLVSLTGVDFLFQDVDIVWYKDPLPYFHDKNSPVHGYDAYFQDDGARSLRYTPWSSNSGFYFIRNNHRTQHFLGQLVLSSDLILKTFSHQQALVAVLSEHASLYGLKVKVLSKDDDGFPGGVHFHRGGRESFFRQFFNGQKDPYIFHMSWTLNKDNKLLFFKQLGEWYVQEQCVEKKLDEISHGDQKVVDVCCSAEALFSCHYRDKPSKYPCSDSPPIDKNGKDFWAD